jgi:hypothetical protein
MVRKAAALRADADQRRRHFESVNARMLGEPLADGSPHRQPLQRGFMPFMRLAPPFATRDAPAAVGLPRLVAMSLRPLSEGNWFQRRYVRWAQPYYDRMAPELRAEVERIDRWLYSRQVLWFWAALRLRHSLPTPIAP